MLARTAPPITRPSEGSHAPAISRNPSTFDGKTIPDSTRPAPKMMPTSNELTIPMSISSDAQYMTDDEYRDKTGGHENHRCHQRTRRQARQATHAMARRTSRTKARPDAHQQPGQNQRTVTGIDRDGLRMA